MNDLAGPLIAAAVQDKTGVLRGTYTFDFEIGAEAPMNACDVWWEQLTATSRRMVPMNGAAIYPMGLIDYAAVDYAAAAALAYTTEPLRADNDNSNRIPTGSTFCIRTRHGKYVKVLVANYDYNLTLRWAICTPAESTLDVKVTLGSTPETLLSRYLADCSYVNANGLQSCGSGSFGPEGGTVAGQVTSLGGQFPPTVTVNLSMDFQPQSGLTGLTKVFTPPVTATGVNFFFEPFQVVQKTTLLIDLRPPVLAGDFLDIRWSHPDGSTIIASGHLYLSSKDLSKTNPTLADIIFIPDPLYADTFTVQVLGRFRGHNFSCAAQAFHLSDKSLVLRPKKDNQGLWSVDIV